MGGDEYQGPTHRLYQGGVSPSSCKIVMEDKVPLLDSWERSVPLLLEVGVENRVLPTHCCCSVPGEGQHCGFFMVFIWRTEGIAKRFLFNGATLFLGLRLGRAGFSWAYLLSVPVGIYGLWLSLVSRLGYTGGYKTKQNSKHHQPTCC